MNPLAIRTGHLDPDATFISGVRVLGPMPCRGCGATVHVVRRWYGLHLAEPGRPGNHECQPLGPGHATVLGHDRASCAICHRLEDARYARAH